MTDFETGKLTHHSEEMIDAYVQGRMPPEEQEAFETYVLDKPALLEQLELAMLMREGLKVQGSSAAKASAAPAYSWRLAAAAVLSIGVGSLIGYSIKEDTGPTQIMAANQLVDSQIINLPMTRSESDAISRVVVREDAGMVVLRVPLSQAHSLPYRVRVTNPAGDVIESLSARPDGAGILNVAMSAENITTGRYEISVSLGADEMQPISPIAVEIVRP